MAGLTLTVVGPQSWIWANVMGMRMAPSTPYLYLWCFVMCMEGASLPSQTQLLKALGFVVPFRWKPHGSNRIVKPVSCN